MGPTSSTRSAADETKAIPTGAAEVTDRSAAEAGHDPICTVHDLAIDIAREGSTVVDRAL